MRLILLASCVQEDTNIGFSRIPVFKLAIIEFAYNTLGFCQCIQIDWDVK